MEERQKMGSFESELEGAKAGIPPATTSGMAQTQPAAAQVECPFCAEQISERAKKCRHCGETIDVTLRRAEEALRASERSPSVYMNAGGGGGAAVSSAGPASQLRPFNHALHIVLSVLTLGWWLIVYLLLYIFRNKNYYY